MSARKVSLTDLRRELSSPALRNYTFLMSLTNSWMTISCLQLWLMPYTSTSTFSVHHLRARSSLRSLLRLPARRTLSLSATVQQARVMIRFVLSFQSRLWHLISRLSLLGDATRHGRCSHVRMRLITARLMV